MQEAIERIRSVDFNTILDQVIDEERFFVLDLIRSQLKKGEGGDGELNEYAWYRNGSLLSKSWIDYKHKIGLFLGGGDPLYDLLGDTGDFYKSLVITVERDNIKIDSLDPKLDSIEASTGMDIQNGHVLTLSEENLEVLRQRILPKIQSKLRGKLGI